MSVDEVASPVVAPDDAPQVARKAAAREFVIAAARLCSERKCVDVRALDVAGQSSICDFMLLATGTSDRQLRTVVNELYDLAGEMDIDHLGGRQRKSGVGGVDSETRWVAIDFIDTVAHLFDAEARLFYDLDNLYDRVKEIDWRDGWNPREDGSTVPVMGEAERPTADTIG
jgi:ribosome-associated protein